MSDIQDLEKYRARKVDDLAFAKVVLRLSASRDFQRVIVQGFCRDYMADLAEVSGDSRVNDKVRAEATATAQAGGHLKRWLMAKEQEALNIEAEIHSIDEELDELRAGSAE